MKRCEWVRVAKRPGPGSAPYVYRCTRDAGHERDTPDVDACYYEQIPYAVLVRVKQ